MKPKKFILESVRDLIQEAYLVTNRDAQFGMSNLSTATSLAFAVL